VGEIRRYLNQVDEASPRIFAKMLLEPNQEQEQALRTYLGQDRFRRMRGLALQLLSRSSANLKGRIVLIPDFMEVPLCRVDWNGREEPTPIWMNISRLMKGEFDQLRLKDDGVTGVDSCYDIVPLGVFKRNYGELILTLAKDWDVRVLWYDWRKDLRIAASLLESKLREWFGVGQTAHLLGVGMGGLVARWFIKEYPDRWRRMWTDSCKSRGGRLLLMGVPNRGTFVASQLLSGHSEIARRLVKIDHREGYSPIVTTFRSFTSVYQLLPRPSTSSEANGDPFKLFRVETYPTELPCETCETDPRISDVEAWQSSRIPLRLLDFGREISSRLEIHDEDDAKMRSNKELFENRTIVIAGYGVPTIVDLDWNPRTSLSQSYVVSRDRGDGLVPLDRQDFQLPYSEAKEYYIRAEHTALMCHPKILSSLTTLLHADFPELLNDRVKLDLESAYPRNLDPGKVVDSDVASNHRAGRDDTEFWGILDHYSGRRHLPEPDDPTVEERLLGEGITRDLSPKSHHEDVTEVGTVKEPKKLTIGLGLVCGPINEVDQWVDSSPVRPDVIAVGLYSGEKPSGPVRDLDVEISNAMLGQDGPGTGDGSPPTSRDPILTQFISRGLIRAELGQPFMMTDPRGQGGDDAPADRLLVVVGMGPPGKFGVPELTVLARELCWAVGRLGKKHLVVGSIGTNSFCGS